MYSRGGGGGGGVRWGEGDTVIFVSVTPPLCPQTHHNSRENSKSPYRNIHKPQIEVASTHAF